MGGKVPVQRALPGAPVWCGHCCIPHIGRQVRATETELRSGEEEGPLQLTWQEDMGGGGRLRKREEELAKVLNLTWSAHEQE